MPLFRFLFRWFSPDDKVVLLPFVRLLLITRIKKGKIGAKKETIDKTNCIFARIFACGLMGSSSRFEAWYARNIEEQESSIINKLRPAAFLPCPPRYFSLRQRDTSALINVHDVNKSFIVSEKRQKSLRSADFISLISFNFDVRTVGQSRFSKVNVSTMSSI